MKSGQVNVQDWAADGRPEPLRGNCHRPSSPPQWSASHVGTPSGCATGDESTSPRRWRLDDQRVSPAYADLEGLPALYLPAGERDTLCPGVVALAEAPARTGVEVTLEQWPGMVHGWQGLVSAAVPEALAWFARVREYLAGLLGDEPPG